MVDVSYLGGLLDAATGLIYLTGGGYYDPETGRFLAPSRFPFDPRRPGSLNPYVPWGRANPLGLLLSILFPWTI